MLRGVVGWLEVIVVGRQAVIVVTAVVAVV